MTEVVLQQYLQELVDTQQRESAQMPRFPNPKGNSQSCFDWFESIPDGQLVLEKICHSFGKNPTPEQIVGHLASFRGSVYEYLSFGWKSTLLPRNQTLLSPLKTGDLTSRLSQETGLMFSPPDGLICEAHNNRQRIVGYCEYTTTRPTKLGYFVAKQEKFKYWKRNAPNPSMRYARLQFIVLTYKDSRKVEELPETDGYTDFDRIPFAINQLIDYSEKVADRFRGRVMNIYPRFGTTLPVSFA